MKNSFVIFEKQLRDTFKNKTILIQFLMFPIMTLIMENTVKMDGMQPHFFVKLFSVMFIGMAPLTCMSAILSEEKEKNTLRVWSSFGVTPWQFLLGTGSYVFFCCFFGIAVFALAGEYTGKGLLEYLMIMTLGVIMSELIGAGIGVFGRNQMEAASISIPVMMVFSFVPMLAGFNNTIQRIGRIFYSQQLSNWILGIGEKSGEGGIGAETILILIANFILAAGFFLMAYQKRGLE